jgi:arylsulfatase A-like enzyme
MGKDNKNMKWIKRILIYAIPALIILAGILIFYDRIFPPGPNILLISIDTLRPDWLSCYDEVQYPTPNIDQLASQGILFENCITPIPITLPAHFSILYSLMPHEEKVYNNGDVIKTDKPSLTQLLKENDKKVQTAAIVSLGVLKKKFNLSAGFDDYNDEFDNEKSLWYRRADEITDEALKWLQNRELKKNPFFLFVHYSDPHEPYAPPDMPVDMEISLNDEPVKKVVLSTGEQYRVLLHLPPGKNEVKFVTIDYDGKPFNQSVKEAKCYLNELRIYPLINVDVKYKNFSIVNLPKKNRLFLGSPAILQLTNNSKRTEKIILVFSGRRLNTIKELRDFYGQEVRFCDQQIGRLIAKLKEWQMLDNLIIILVSDHGEGLGQHFLTGHIEQLYDSLLKVVCIIYNPKLKQKGLRVKQQVGLIDIAPTILKLWKIKIPDFMQGRPLLTNELKLINPVKERIFFSETFAPQAKSTKFSLRTNKWKLIFTPSQKRWELFDVANDIGENHDLYEKEKDKKNTISLMNELKEKYSHLLGMKRKLDKEKLDRDTLEMLKSLGYIN